MPAQHLDRVDYASSAALVGRQVLYDPKELPRTLRHFVRYPNFPLSEYLRLHQRRVLADLAGLVRSRGLSYISHYPQ